MGVFAEPLALFIIWFFESDRSNANKNKFNNTVDISLGRQFKVWPTETMQSSSCDDLPEY